MESDSGTPTSCLPRKRLRLSCFGEQYELAWANVWPLLANSSLTLYALLSVVCLAQCHHDTSILQLSKSAHSVDTCPPHPPLECRWLLQLFAQLSTVSALQCLLCQVCWPTGRSPVLSSQGPGLHACIFFTCSYLMQFPSIYDSMLSQALPCASSTF